MDCFSATAGSLAQSLGGSAGGSTEKAVHAFGAEDLQNPPNNSCLAHAGAAGDDQYLLGRCLAYSLPLIRGKLQTDPLFHPFQGCIGLNGGQRMTPLTKR